MPGGRIGTQGGGILTASLMFAGAACLTLSSAFLVPSSVPPVSSSDADADADDDGGGAGAGGQFPDPSTLFRAVAMSMFLFGLGVGGEYPVSAASASERVMSSSSSSSSIVRMNIDVPWNTIAIAQRMIVYQNVSQWPNSKRDTARVA